MTSTAEVAESVVPVTGIDMVSLLGTADEVLRAVEHEFAEVTVAVRDQSLVLRGPKQSVAQARQVFEHLRAVVSGGTPVDAEDVRRVLRVQEAGQNSAAADVLSQTILSSRGKTVRPKTLGQKNYVKAIDEHTIVFGIGPAGTGKTYLAMAKAVQALTQKQVSRIILTRPAVEAGERLGFLPGTLTDKIDPYLRPLFDAIHEMLDPETVPKLLETGVIEVAPLAYMRGRTLNDSFVVLDEAQNTTPEQMKMFLTRLGFGSKMVVTGDVTQVDLPGGVSGLQTVRNILHNIEDIHFSEFGPEDVVRHSLVGEIVDAYTAHDATTSRPNKTHRAAGPQKREKNR